MSPVEEASRTETGGDREEGAPRGILCRGSDVGIAQIGNLLTSVTYQEI